MSPNQPQPTDAFDTSELELPPATDLPTAEVEQGRPSWDPEEGDFT
jgi:hypothetical protein